MKEKSDYCHDKIHDIAEYVRRWGNAISLSLLDPACTLFTTPNHEGVIGYRFVSMYAIVFGDPVCPKEKTAALLGEFHSFCRVNNKKIIYIAASEHFTQLALGSYCNTSIEMGVNLSLNPMDNAIGRSGRKSSMLRNKFNQAIRSGIEVKEYCEHDGDLERGMQEVQKAWLQDRKGLQIYLYTIDLFTNRSNKRWFYAVYNKEIVGVIMLNRIDFHGGWALNILMVKPDAPTIVSEFIVLSVLETLRLETCNHFSVGAIPADVLGQIKGLGKVSCWFAQMIYKIARKMFNLENRQRYWKKFHPHTQPTFVVLSHSSIKLSDVLGIIHALHGKTQ